MKHFFPRHPRKCIVGVVDLSIDDTGKSEVNKHEVYIYIYIYIYTYYKNDRAIFRIHGSQAPDPQVGALQ